MIRPKNISKRISLALVAAFAVLVFAGSASAVLTKAQFLAKNPGGDYAKYLSYVIKKSENPAVVEAAKNLKASDGKTTSTSGSTKTTAATTSGSTSGSTKTTAATTSGSTKTSTSGSAKVTEEGVYGPGGEKKWRENFVKQLNDFEQKTGVTIPAWAKTPEGWAKFIGYEPPEWAKKIHEANGTPAMAGSDPFDYKPKTEEAKLLLLNASFGLNASSVEEVLEEVELARQFAQREQWVTNLNNDNAKVAANTHLQNLNWDSSDPEKNLNYLFGVVSQAIEDNGVAGGFEQVISDFEKQKELVPEWAPEVKEQLNAQGVPFRVELLMSPEINLYDPSKPLFPEGSNPTSLFSLGSLQSGENAYLRGLSAEELMLQLSPLVDAYSHRPAGAPVPEGLEGGLTFGGGTWVECSENTQNGCINGKKLQRSAVTDTDSYTRWTALGQPGSKGVGQSNGTVTNSVSGWVYVPLTGEFYDGGTDGVFGGSQIQSHQRSMIEKFMNGTFQPSHFMTPWREVVEAFIVSRTDVAGYLQDPSHYFTGVYEKHNPANMGQDARDRMLAMIYGDPESTPSEPQADEGGEE